MAKFFSKKLTYVLKTLLCSVCLIVSVLPGFDLLGNLLMQVFVTVVVSLIILLVFDLVLKTDPQIFSFSLACMTAFWVLYALIEQIQAHFQTPEEPFSWFQLFYYDRPALLFVVFFVCLLYFVIKLLIKKDDADFVKNYKSFIKTTTCTFLVYYMIILIYSFVLVRKITFERPVVNLKPFEMMIFTFTRGYIDYELLFLFLGNIAIFLPLGVLIAALTKKKLILGLFPFLLSFSIEVSQFFLGNGHPDIDDLILNVVGFYLGVALKLFLDFLVRKSTKGKLDSFFIF